MYRRPKTEYQVKGRYFYKKLNKEQNLDLPCGIFGAVFPMAFYGFLPFGCRRAKKLRIQ